MRTRAHTHPKKREATAICAPRKVHTSVYSFSFFRCDCILKSRAPKCEHQFSRQLKVLNVNEREKKNKTLHGLKSFNVKVDESVNHS